jgi:hypothetical protein
MSAGGTRMVNGSTLTVSDSTRIVDGSTLTVGGGPQTLGIIITSIFRWQHYTTDNIDSAAPSLAQLGHVITTLSNIFPFASTRQRSDLACMRVAELDSIRIIACCV